MKSGFSTIIGCLMALQLNAQRCLIEENFGSVKELYSRDGGIDSNYYEGMGQSGGYGVIDKKGNLIVPDKYRGGFINCNGKVVAIDRNKKLAEVWDLKTKTKVKLPAISAGDVIAENGLIAVEVANDKWGYCDMKGKIVIPAKFTYAETFIKNKAVAETGGKYGIINEKGVWVVQPKASYYYRWVTPTLLTVQVDDKDGNSLYGLMDDNGKILMKPEKYTEVEDRGWFLEFKLEKKKGALFNYSGKKLTDDDCWVKDNNDRIEGANGLILAMDSKGFAFVIDTSGNRYLNNKYPYIYRHEHFVTKKPTGLYTVQTSQPKDDKAETYDIVKLDGTVLLTGTINSVINYDENIILTAVENNKTLLYSMVKPDGTVIGKNLCNDVAAFHKQYAFVRKDGKCGAINMQTGEWAIPMIYKDVTEVNDCTIKFIDDNGADVFFDQNLKIKK